MVKMILMERSQFSASRGLGRFSACWRSADFASVTKKSPSSDVGDHMPTSITPNPILSKVFVKSWVVS